MLRKTPTTNLMYFGEQRSGRLDPQMGHLTCFVGGLYVLSTLSGASSSNSSSKHEMEIAQGIGKTCRESYVRTGSVLLERVSSFQSHLCSLSQQVASVPKPSISNVRTWKQNHYEIMKNITYYDPKRSKRGSIYGEALTIQSTVNGLGMPSS